MPCVKPFLAEFVEPRRPGRYAWLVLGMATAAAVAAWALAHHWDTEAASLQQRTQSLLVAAATTPASAPPYVPPVYAQSAHEMLAEAGSGWWATLNALERVARPGVTPVSVEISTKGRTCRVEVAFSDYAELLAYRAALDEGNAKSEWTLETAQSQLTSGGAGRAVLRRAW